MCQVDAIRNLRNVAGQPHGKEVVFGTAPQHKERLSSHESTFHTILKPCPLPRHNNCVQCQGKKTHISQTAGFGRTPVTLSLITYSLFHIRLFVGFTTYNYCQQGKKKKVGKYWKGGV